MSDFDVEESGLDAVQTQLDNLSAQFSVMKNRAVVSDVPYAVYVEFGTGPHVIRPKDDGVLAFEAGGETVFTTVVHHPGTPPNGALRKAVAAAMANLDAIAADADSGDDLMEKIADFIKRGWKQEVWVDTGRLKRSIHVEEL